jgi:hypothetical protein
MEIDVSTSLTEDEVIPTIVADLSNRVQYPKLTTMDTP